MGNATEAVSAESNDVDRSELVEFLGPEYGGLVADTRGLDSVAEVVEDTKPESPEVTEPPAADQKEADPTEAVKEGVKTEPTEAVEPDLAIKAMQAKLDSIADDVTGLKAEPEKDPEPELSAREKLGLPDLDSEDYESHFELYPEQKEVMIKQQEVMIKQQERMDEQQVQLDEGKLQLGAEQTKQFWGAVKQDHADFLEYVSVDGSETPKFSEWVKEQPAFLQAAYKETYKAGSASDTNSLIAMMKGPAEEITEVKPDIKAKPDPQAELIKKGMAKVAAIEAEEALPKSISDIPGVSKATDPLEGLADSGDIVADLHKVHGGNFNKQQAIVDSMV